MGAPTTTVNVLAILPAAEDRTSLQRILEQPTWNLRAVEALTLARPMIDELPAGVVITDSQLPDGCWQDVVLELRRQRLEPMLIVASRLADESLWAEVLNLGGYDVLATPLRATEVIRSLTLAGQQWQEKLASLPVNVMSAGQTWPGVS